MPPMALSLSLERERVTWLALQAVEFLALMALVAVAFLVLVAVALEAWVAVALVALAMVALLVPQCPGSIGTWSVLDREDSTVLEGAAWNDMCAVTTSALNQATSDDAGRHVHRPS